MAEREEGSAAGRTRGRCCASVDTSLTAVHDVIPSVKTSADASSSRASIFATTSASTTGPTCWPPIAMYHCLSATGILLWNDFRYRE